MTCYTIRRGGKRRLHKRISRVSTEFRFLRFSLFCSSCLTEGRKGERRRRTFFFFVSSAMRTKGKYFRRPDRKSLGLLLLSRWIVNVPRREESGRTAALKALSIQWRWHNKRRRWNIMEEIGYHELLREKSSSKTWKVRRCQHWLWVLGGRVVRRLGVYESLLITFKCFNCSSRERFVFYDAK